MMLFWWNFPGMCFNFRRCKLRYQPVTWLGSTPGDMIPGGPEGHLSRGMESPLLHGHLRRVCASGFQYCPSCWILDTSSSTVSLTLSNCANYYKIDVNSVSGMMSYHFLNTGGLHRLALVVNGEKHGIIWLSCRFF